MTVKIRKWFVTEALVSYQRLGEVLGDMSEPEVLEALKVESKTRRRQSFIDRLIARACRLNEISYQQQLKEKHDPSRLQNPQ